MLGALVLTGCTVFETRQLNAAKTVVSHAGPSGVNFAEKAGAKNAVGLPRRIVIKGLNLSDAVGLAISHHPDIARANAEIVRSVSEVSIAEAAWYPTFQYGLRPGYGQSDNGNTVMSANASVSINQLVYDFGRTSSRISAADATLNQQKHLQEDTVEAVAYKAATSFVSLAASQDVIAAAQRQLKVLGEIGTKIAERVEAGLSDASDLNQADIAIQRAEAEVVKAQTAFDVTAGELAELIGVRPKETAPLSGAASLIAKLGEDPADVEKSPAVLAASSAMEAADARLSLARAEQYPSIGVGVSRTFSQSRAASDNDLFVGLTLSGSYSLGGLAKHQIATAEAEKATAAQLLQNQRLLTRTALNSAKTEASGASARLSSYDKVINLSRSSRDLYWQEYTLNKRTLSEVINAEREIFSSETEHISAQEDGVKARIKAYSSIGRLVTMLREREGRRK